MKKTTYIELKRFTGVASAFLQSPSPETPLHYALRKICRRAESVVRPIEEESVDRRIDLASIDEKKNVTFDARGNYQFTRENLAKLNEFLRQQDQRAVEIETHFVPPEKIPTNLPPAFVDAFTGFVIDPEQRDVASNLETNVVAIEHLIGANELLRSAHTIAERNGEKTNWPAFKDCLAKVLQNQHELLHGREYHLNNSFEGDSYAPFRDNLIEILKEQRALCADIEKLPASTEATNLSIKASKVAGWVQQIVYPT